MEPRASHRWRSSPPLRKRRPKPTRATRFNSAANAVADASASWRPAGAGSPLPSAVTAIQTAAAARAVPRSAFRSTWSRDDARPCTKGAAATRPPPSSALAAWAHASRSVGPGPDRRRDRVDERRRGGDQEPAHEEQVEPASLDPEPDGGEDRDEGAGEGHRGVDHEPKLGKLVGRLEPGLAREQGQDGREQAEQQELAREPGLVRVLRRVATHVP